MGTLHLLGDRVVAAQLTPVWGIVRIGSWLWLDDYKLTSGLVNIGYFTRNEWASTQNAASKASMCMSRAPKL
jgi:hypothetical protein